jgi:16S rRNA processing protein RimM
MTKLENPVLMAVIGAAHGIKGEVRVKTYTGEPLALGDYGTLFARDGRAFEIQALRPQGNTLVARLKGVDDRNAAEALTGTELFVERAALKGDLEEEEFYHADLIGMDAVDEEGATLGKVTAVQNYGAGDILEIRGSGLRGAVLVPFTRAAVPSVDVAMRTIRIDRAAAGLLDDEDDQPDAAQSGEGDGFDPGRRPRGPRDAGGNR